MQKTVDEDTVICNALDAGADDVATEEEFYEVKCNPTVFVNVLNKIRDNLPVQEELSDVMLVPTNEVEIDNAC